jgi:hypothetical protein
VSGDQRRWAQRAQELKFHQLEAARKQAEGWRTGLGGLTALLGAVLIIRGRDNIATLATPYRWLVVMLLGVALASLAWGTLLAVRAASGAPGEECLLTGEDLQEWTRQEVREVQRVLAWAARLAVGGVAAVALAVGFTWLGPTGGTGRTHMVVEYGADRVCGELAGAANGNLIVQTSPKDTVVIRLVPLTAVTRITPVPAC